MVILEHYPKGDSGLAWEIITRKETTLGLILRAWMITIDLLFIEITIYWQEPRDKKTRELFKPQ